MKIGILTHFYNTNNYGGALQAYALTHVLRKMGHDAEQICFERYEETLDINSIRESDNIVQNSDNTKVVYPSKLRIMLFKVKRFLLYPYYTKKTKRKLEWNKTIENDYFVPRAKAFAEFQKKIPHSPIVYRANTLFLANECYDGFISGSDQVFNFLWHVPAFFLDFADDEKTKIAYAASAGASEFDEVQKKYLKRVLPKFDAISVREADLVGLYKDIAEVDSQWVLDPVLLLDKKYWITISSPKMIKEPYLFCFFYNPQSEYYTLCKDYATEHNLKIVTIPYATCDIRANEDVFFGDEHIKNASPEDFISLILHADCIFTDSFHCNAFSIIFDRPFFTFVRTLSDSNKGKKLSSRITSLTQMFGCEERFCNTEDKMTLDYLNSVKETSYSKEEYNKMQIESLEFLERNLYERSK